MRFAAITAAGLEKALPVVSDVVAPLVADRSTKWSHAGAKAMAAPMLRTATGMRSERDRRGTTELARTTKDHPEHAPRRAQQPADHAEDDAGAAGVRPTGGHHRDVAQEKAKADGTHADAEQRAAARRSRARQQCPGKEPGREVKDVGNELTVLGGERDAAEVGGEERDDTAEQPHREEGDRPARTTPVGARPEARARRWRRRRGGGRDGGSELGVLFEHREARPGAVPAIGGLRPAFEEDGPLLVQPPDAEEALSSADGELLSVLGERDVLRHVVLPDFRC